MIGKILEFARGAGLEFGKQEYLTDNFIPGAVSIARRQGWVSPSNISSKFGLTQRDAQIILLGACRQGLLFQAIDGRFYMRMEIPEPTSAPNVVSETFTALDGEEDYLDWNEHSHGRMVFGTSGRRRKLYLVPLMLVAGTVAAICSLAVLANSGSFTKPAPLPVAKVAPTPTPTLTPSKAWTEVAMPKVSEFTVVAPTPAFSAVATSAPSAPPPPPKPHLHKHAKAKPAPKPAPSAAPPPNPEKLGDIY